MISLPSFDIKSVEADLESHKNVQFNHSSLAEIEKKHLGEDISQRIASRLVTITCPDIAKMNYSVKYYSPSHEPLGTMTVKTEYRPSVGRYLTLGVTTKGVTPFVDGDGERLDRFLSDNAVAFRRLVLEKIVSAHEAAIHTIDVLRNHIH